MRRHDIKWFMVNDAVEKIETIKIYLNYLQLFKLYY